MQLRQVTLAVVGSDRIECRHCSTVGLQAKDYIDGLCITHVIRVGFEGKSKNRNFASFDTAHTGNNRINKALWLQLIGCDGSFKEWEWHASRIRGVEKTGGVLRETTTAIADSSVEEGRSNTLILPNTLHHLNDICTCCITEVSNRVREGDLRAARPDAYGA